MGQEPILEARPVDVLPELDGVLRRPVLLLPPAKGGEARIRIMARMAEFESSQARLRARCFVPRQNLKTLFEVEGARLVELVGGPGGSRGVPPMRCSTPARPIGGLLMLRRPASQAPDGTGKPTQVAEPPVLRVRRALELAFYEAYGRGDDPELLELRLLKQHLLRWLVPRKHSKLRVPPLLATERRAIDAHMRGLVVESATRLITAPGGSPGPSQGYQNRSV